MKSLWSNVKKTGNPACQKERAIVERENKRNLVMPSSVESETKGKWGAF